MHILIFQWCTKMGFNNTITKHFLDRISVRYKNKSLTWIQVTLTYIDHILGLQDLIDILYCSNHPMYTDFLDNYLAYIPKYTLQWGDDSADQHNILDNGFYNSLPTKFYNNLLVKLKTYNLNHRKHKKSLPFIAVSKPKYTSQVNTSNSMMYTKVFVCVYVFALFWFFFVKYVYIYIYIYASLVKYFAKDFYYRLHNPKIHLFDWYTTTYTYHVFVHHKVQVQQRYYIFWDKKHRIFFRCIL